MITAVRIVSPPDYPHSNCFNEVAEAFASALSVELNGGVEGDQNLIFGAHLLPFVPPSQRARKRDILYNSEVVFEGNPWFSPQYIRLLRSHEVWDYSPKNVEELKKLGIAAKFVPIRYMPCMTKNFPAATQDIDVLFYGSMNERRDKIIQSLLNEGIEVYKAFNVYGKERDDLISRSKIVLNIHQHDAAIFEIFRCAHLMANSKCVVSEEGLDEELEELYPGMIFCRQEELVELCGELLGTNSAARCYAAERNAITWFKEPLLSDELRRIGVLC